MILKLKLTIFIILSLSIKSLGSPRFISNLRLSNEITCYNSNVELMVSVAEADYYSFQIQSTSGQWIDVKTGNPLLISGDLILQLNNLTWSANYRVELKNTEINETIYSNIVLVNFQRPIFTSQPQNAQNCNGSDAYFYTQASSTSLLNYQWQISTNGGASYANLSNNSNYSGVTTNSLKVIGLINSDHQDIFKCKVTDQQGCTNETTTAELFVNQLTSTVSPTLSTTFCAGEKANFQLSGIVGLPDKINWFMKNSGASAFVQLIDTSKYEGLNSNRLTVRNIEVNQNSYKADVYFKTTNFDKDGNLISGECVKSATRSNYIIYSRPESNFSVADSFACNSSNVLLKSSPQTNTYYWYSDTLNNQISINSGNFLSPFLEKTQTFFVRKSDSRNCKSYAKPVVASIFSKPRFEILDNLKICPNEKFINIEIKDLETDFDLVNINSGTKPLIGFNNLENVSYIKNELLDIELPENKQAGDYNFKFFVQNSQSTCNSDTSLFNLKIEKPPLITNYFNDDTRCEESGYSLNVVVDGMAPFQYIWRKNGTVLSLQNTATLKFDSLRLSDQGNYDCVVINQCGSDTSNLMRLSINPKLKIISQAMDTEVCEGQSTVLSIQAVGSGEITYKWFKNNQEIDNSFNTLSLENLSFLENNTSYFCKLQSSCGSEINSDTIKLKVKQRPQIPVSFGKISFCQNENSEALKGSASEGNMLLWYQGSLESEPNVVPPIPNTANTGLQEYWLSQINVFGCESQPLAIHVVVNTPIETNLSSDFETVCSTGTLNTEAKLIVGVIGGDSTHVFTWFKDDLELFNLNSNELITEKGGQFKVEVSNAACKSHSSIEIGKLSEELKKEIYNNDYMICKNGTAYLFAEGEFNSGRFTWWENDTIADFLSDINPFLINNIQNSRNIYVSYVKKIGSLSCESDRKLIKIAVQSPIIINTILINESCTNAKDGKIEVLLENQIGSVFYKLNEGDYVETNVFENLKADTYKIQVIDSLSCTANIEISLISEPEPQFILQPISQTKCKGNTVNFNFSAQNYGTINWQKKIPGGLFQDIPNESSTNLRITNVGSTSHPHLTKYRAVITNTKCEVFSDEVQLFVNSFTNTLQSQTVCNGLETIFESPTKLGIANTFQWQKRIGSTGSFIDIATETKNSLILKNVSEVENNTYYKCKVQFLNPDNSTCLLTSDDAKLTVMSPSRVKLSNDTSICISNSVVLKANDCNGTVLWSNSMLGVSITVNPIDNISYTALCKLGDCISEYSDTVNISVLGKGLVVPIIEANSNYLCGSDSIILSINNCTQSILWNTGDTLLSIKVLPNQTIAYSAICKDQFCSSPKSKDFVITVPQQLSGGQITPYLASQCAGFNPGEIFELRASSGGRPPYTYTWQKTENCFAEIPIWTDIVNTNNQTFNPNALFVSTCFRRQTVDSCSKIEFSNHIYFDIIEDPKVEIRSSSTVYCPSDKLGIYPIINGGVGVCHKIWQINTVSGAISSSFWQNFATDIDTLNLENLETLFPDKSNLYFRLKYDCENSNCNLAYSNILQINIKALPVVEIGYSNNTICKGQSLTLEAKKCLGSISWNDGLQTTVIIIRPDKDSLFVLKCQTGCGIAFDTLQVYVSDSLGLATNTTPLSSTMSSIVQFSAIGTNLKWFISPSQEIGSDLPYTINTAGEHIVYVAQSNSSCIGSKLKIKTLVYPNLGIISQPQNYTNCKGNGAKINVEAVGAGQIQYQWYRKRPQDIEFMALNNEMSGIRNSNTKELSITSIGNANNPDSTEYKCEIKDSLNSIFSEIARLEVNYLEGNLPDLSACVGNDLSIDANTYFKIRGSISSIQWQIKPEEDWLDFDDTFSIIGSKSLNLKFLNIQESNSSKYRIRVNFNSETGTCIESSDQSIVTIQDFPKIPEAFEIEHCQFDKVVKIPLELEKGIIGLWYLTDNKNESPLKSIPTPATDQSGELIYYLALMNKSNCISPRQKIVVRINPQPSLPISLMKDEYFDGGLLIFEAKGTNLKWYSTKTTKTFSLDAPQFFKVGNAQYYVSQTNQFECESDRVLIKTSIINKLGLTSNLENQTDCEGNSVSFSVKTKNSFPFEIAWYKKIKGKNEFELIPNQNSKTLNISNIGSETFPDSTEIKCILKDSLFTVESNAAWILVNKIDAKLNDLNVCDNGQDLIKSERFNVVGNVANYILQNKIGNSYLDLISNFDANTTLINSIKSGTYRIKVNFGTNGKIACTRSSSDFKVKINEHPPQIKNSKFDICQSNSLSDIKFDNPTSNTFHWFDNDKMNEINSIRDRIPGSYQFLLVQKDKNSCVSEPSVQNINILQTPILNTLDTSYTYCMLDNSVKNVFNEELNYLDSKGDLFDKKAFSFENSGIYYFKAFKIDSNFCESNKVDIKINIIPCYLSSIVEPNCELLNYRIVTQNKGFYLNSEGKIAAETNSIIDNQGNLSISNSNNIKLFKPYFFFDFKTKTTIDLKLNTDFFVANTSQKRIYINKYSGKNSDCQTDNNDNFIEGEAWQLAESIDIKYQNEFQIFKVLADGKFELGFTTDSLFSLSNFYHQKAENTVNIKWEANYQSSPLKYRIQKSINKVDWYTITTISIEGKNNFEFVDEFPISGKSFYRLIYQDEMGLKKLSKILELNYEPKKSICKVSPNPIKIDEPIYLKTNFSDINSVEIFDILGRQIPASISKNGLGVFEIKPIVKLINGQYFIKGIDSNNKMFSCRFGL